MHANKRRTYSRRKSILPFTKNKTEAAKKNNLDSTPRPKSDFYGRKQSYEQKLSEDKNLLLHDSSIKESSLCSNFLENEGTAETSTDDGTSEELEISEKIENSHNNICIGTKATDTEAYMSSSVCEESDYSDIESLRKDSSKSESKELKVTRQRCNSGKDDLDKIHNVTQKSKGKMMKRYQIGCTRWLPKNSTSLFLPSSIEDEEFSSLKLSTIPSDDSDANTSYKINKIQDESNSASLVTKTAKPILTSTPLECDIIHLPREELEVSQISYEDNIFTDVDEENGFFSQNENSSHTPSINRNKFPSGSRNEQKIDGTPICCLLNVPCTTIRPRTLIVRRSQAHLYDNSEELKITDEQ